LITIGLRKYVKTVTIAPILQISLEQMYVTHALLAGSQHQLQRPSASKLFIKSPNERASLKHPDHHPQRIGINGAGLPLQFD